MTAAAMVQEPRLVHGRQFVRDMQDDDRSLVCGSPLERMALWWRMLHDRERVALCLLAELPVDRSAVFGFFELCATEQDKILHAVKGGGVLCELVMQERVL